MVKKLLTFDDLYQFFVEQNKTIKFNSKDSGAPIVVSLPGTFAETDNNMPGLLKLKLKVCHTQLNRNGSFISQDNMEKGMPTLKYRPILAYIHELEDGTKDFYAHNVEVLENEDGESEVNYIEKQVGCFTADDPWLEYDEKMDKTYVMAYSVIPEEYTEAADIIRRKNGTKVSCELVINELSYNAKEKYLDLTDFYFSGCTLLGCDEDGNEIGEGMLGARADIADFCHEEPIYTYQDKMIEVLEKLNVTLSNFNTNTTQKGGSEMKFEELLAKYGKTAEEVTFEIEGLSDEELEVKFAEAFGDDDGNDDVSESQVDNEDGEGKNSDADNSENDDSDDDDCVNTDDDDGNDGSGEGGTNPQTDEKFVLKYELSHDDIRAALYSLLAATDEDGYCCTWIAEVYDNKFIYHDCKEDKFYRQGYSKDDDCVALDGEAVEVFNEWLSKDEKDALDALKTSYAELKAFKDNYDAAQIKAEKDSIFESAEYAEIRESDEFKYLMSESENYSVDEIKVKADLLYAASMKKKFAVETENEKKHTVGVNFNAKPTKKSAYGKLFDN